MKLTKNWESRISSSWGSKRLPKCKLSRACKRSTPAKWNGTIPLKKSSMNLPDPSTKGSMRSYRKQWRARCEIRMSWEAHNQGMQLGWQPKGIPPRGRLWWKHRSICYWKEKQKLSWVMKDWIARMLNLEEGIDRREAIHDRSLKHQGHFQSNRWEGWAKIRLKEHYVAHVRTDLITVKGCSHLQVITRKLYRNQITPICPRTPPSQAALFSRI